MGGASFTRTGSGADRRFARLDWVTLASGFEAAFVLAPVVTGESDVVAPGVVAELEVALELRSVPTFPV